MTGWAATMTCRSDPTLYGDRRLHVWGLMRGMEVGARELVEESMFGPTPEQAARNLSEMVRRAKVGAIRGNVYRTEQECPGIRAIVRTA